MEACTSRTLLLSGFAASIPTASSRPWPAPGPTGTRATEALRLRRGYRVPGASLLTRMVASSSPTKPITAFAASLRMESSTPSRVPAPMAIPATEVQPPRPSLLTPRILRWRPTAACTSTRPATTRSVVWVQTGPSVPYGMEAMVRRLSGHISPARRTAVFTSPRITDGSSTG